MSFPSTRFHPPLSDCKSWGKKKTDKPRRVERKSCTEQIKQTVLTQHTCNNCLLVEQRLPCIFTHFMLSAGATLGSDKRVFFFVSIASSMHLANIFIFFTGIRLLFVWKHGEEILHAFNLGRFLHHFWTQQDFGSVICTCNPPAPVSKHKTFSTAFA